MLTRSVPYNGQFLVGFSKKITLIISKAMKPDAAGEKKKAVIYGYRYDTKTKGGENVSQQRKIYKCKKPPL